MSSKKPSSPRATSPSSSSKRRSGTPSTPPPNLPIDIVPAASSSSQSPASSPQATSKGLNKKGSFWGSGHLLSSNSSKNNLHRSGSQELWRSQSSEAISEESKQGDGDVGGGVKVLRRIASGIPTLNAPLHDLTHQKFKVSPSILLSSTPSDSLSLSFTLSIGHVEN